MATDWHTLYQETRPDVMPGGRLVRMRDIHFEIDTEPAKGTQDSVSVEDRPGYSETAVPLIDAKVAEIKRMHTA